MVGNDTSLITAIFLSGIGFILTLFSQLTMNKNLRLILFVVLFVATIRFLTDFCNLQWFFALIITSASFIFINIIIKYFLKKTGKIS